jgi:hypothetical protein
LWTNVLKTLRGHGAFRGKPMVSTLCPNFAQNCYRIDLER